MEYDLVIFDCDGVLVDSEIIYHCLGAKEMSKLGFPLTVERSIEVFSGVSDKDFARAVEAEYGRPISSTDLSASLKKIRDSFQTDLKSVPGISSVLEFLSEQGLDKCIVSNGSEDHILRALSLSGLKHFFSEDRIFNISMVKKGKPEPDLFLLAAKESEVDPADCVVIEDSVVGIQAAKAANMRVIGFLGATHAGNSSYRETIVNAKPDILVNDAAELLQLLSN